MLRLAVAVWLLLSHLAMAQVVTVRSGQHDGFSRLVLTFPEPAGWDLGRTLDGYGFRARKPGWRYDISTVFDLIPRDRLAALWVDPDSGVLRLGIGCACHAVATPFRPGIVVVDILDGTAPAGSPYETALADAGRALPPLVARQTLRPRPRPAGLVPEPVAMPDLMTQEKSAVPAFAPPLVIPSPDPRTVAMRDQLLRDLSRGIAAGAIKPTAPLPVQDRPQLAAGPTVLPLAPGPEAPAQLRIRAVGAMPDLTLTGSGQPCISDDRLDLAAWGDGRHPLVQLVSARSGLLGEFDRPDRDRLIALVRLNLHLGFGAEARSLMRLWGQDDPEAVVLDSLGLLVDGQAGALAFAGMQECDTAAALWSVLSQDAPATGPFLNRAAVLRAFSALPLGLRRHLGPGLSDKAMAVGDADSARAVRDAIDRAPGPHGDGLALIEARLDLADGRAEVGEQRLETIVADDGAAAAQALATLIETRLGRGEVPEASQVLALDAMMRERGSATDAGVLRQALAKGLAVTGAAERAFREHAPEDPALYPQLWGLLAQQGALLDLAGLALDPPAGSKAAVPVPVRLAIAERLRSGGFAEGAGRWANGANTPEADLLLARVALDQRDGREALRHLAGQTGTAAEALRARSLELLGDLQGAALAWDAAGSPGDAERVRFLDRRWDDLTSTDPQIKDLLAQRAEPPPLQTLPAAPLAQARALMEGSQTVRDIIGTVLAAREVPGSQP